MRFIEKMEGKPSFSEEQALKEAKEDVFSSDC